MKAKQLGYGLRRIENVELQEPNQVSFLRARAMAAGFLLVKESDSDSEDGGKSKKPIQWEDRKSMKRPAASGAQKSGCWEMSAGKSKGRMDDTVLTDKDKKTDSE